VSWDIHGNPLPVGHCEVHPDQPEPYPCQVCQYEIESDRSRAEQEQAAFEEWAYSDGEAKP
jgi:hypothetical protein